MSVFDKDMALAVLVGWLKKTSDLKELEFIHKLQKTNRSTQDVATFLYALGSYKQVLHLKSKTAILEGAKSGTFSVKGIQVVIDHNPLLFRSVEALMMLSVRGNVPWQVFIDSLRGD